MDNFTHGKIMPVVMEKEIQDSFIDYAMSVITSRALPDVRDGLKPVHRRILFSMYKTGMFPDKAHKKSAHSSVTCWRNTIRTATYPFMMRWCAWRRISISAILW